MKRNPDLGAAIDERLSAAIERANYQITLNNQKQNARLKLDVDLTYATGGGLFKINPELINFVTTLQSMGHDDAVILDVNKNPTHIQDLAGFKEIIVEQYFQALNEYTTEINRIKKARKPEALVQ